MRRRTPLSGLAGCYRSPAIRGFCLRCGQRGFIMHMPMRGRHPYCSRCCPECNPVRRVASAAQGGPGMGEAGPR